MQSNSLYATLVASLYALHGPAGEFLGQLAQPIPSGDLPPVGTLAVFPREVA
jgi:hypothetical protein